jgi:hypothetical protein
MGIPIANTVWYVAGSSGTADFSDGTALTGYRNIAAAVAAGSLVNGGVYTYRAEHPTDKLIWENGSGAVNTGTGVVARTTIAESSTGAKIDFAVAPVVFFTHMKRDFDLLAPLNSPSLTGNPTAPTASPGDADTSIATTGFVKAAIDVILGGVSASFDTLSEIATSLGGKLTASNNLSDVGSAVTSRSNLGINAASLSPSSNTILALADHGALINATGTFTQTITAAATLGDKWRVFYRNNGTGVITLDPNGSENVNGTPTWKLYPGEGVEIICDGSNLFIINDSARVLLDTQTASSSATLDFTRFDSVRFSSYEFIFSEVLPATDAVVFQGLISNNGGSSFGSSGYYDARHASVSDGSSGDAGNLNQAQWALMTNIANTVGFAGQLLLTITPVAARFQFHASFVVSGGAPGSVVTAGLNNVTGGANAVRFKMSSGNIASGTVRMYGIR